MLSFKKILLPLRWYDLCTAPFFIMDTVLGYRKQCRLPLTLRFRSKIVWGCAKILTLSLLKELSHMPRHVYIQIRKNDPEIIHKISAFLFLIPNLGGGGTGGVTLENEKLYIFQLFFNQIYFNKKLRHLKPGTGSLNKSKRSSLENVCRALLTGLQQHLPNIVFPK